jgi:PKHD-type hydroxylase
MPYSTERVWDFVPSDPQTVPAVFTTEECARIIALHETLGVHAMSSKNQAGSYRSTDVFWLHGTNAAYGWIFKRLTEVTREFNARTYQFELDSCADLQLGRYGPDQHYEWHCDVGRGGYSRRKLSISVLLSDPSQYQGGGLEFGVDIYKISMVSKRGDAVYFPSWTPHRVIPVTSGERWSLVAWWLGPPFR